MYRAASGGVSDPPNNSGTNPLSLSYAGGNAITTTTNGASYDCFAPNARVINDTIVPVLNDGDDVNIFYITQTALYRFLYDNESILNTNTNYTDFYNGLAGSSIDIFIQVESALAANDLESALYLKSKVTSTNSIKSNYLSYYDLYIAYASVNFLNDPDISSTDLLTLASLCPGTDGACVYQARALYNSVFHNSRSYPVCSSSTERKARHNDKSEQASNWKINLYHNPAADRLIIQSNTEDERLNITIFDLSGRTLLMKDLKLKGFIANLDLNLTNGAYLLSITNSQDEMLIKKLLINQ